MHSNNPLGESGIFSLIVKYSVPAIVGMMVSAFYNIVDRIFIGNSSDLGADGLAGITIAFPIMIIIFSIGILFGIGGATLFSIRLGEGHRQDAEKALGNALVMLVVSGLILMITGQILLRPLLLLFGASDSVLPYSLEYMRIIFFGTTFQIVSLGMNNFIRADGNPRIAMWTMFLGAGLNIILDAIFIFGLRLGMTGAALATVLSQLSSFIWVLAYFTGKKSRVRLYLRNLVPQISIVWRIITLGLPGFLLQLANSLLMTILNRNLLAFGGDIAVSGMGVISSLQTIFVLPVIGLRQGVQPIISFNYGARKYGRVKSAAKMAILMATVILLTGYLIIRLFPVQLISLFNRDPELLSFGSMALVTWFLCLPLVGLQVLGANYFQSIGKSMVATFLTLTRQVIFLIPALLIFSDLWGLSGLLYAAPFADFLSSLVTGACFIYSMRKIGRDNFDHLTGSIPQPD